MVTKHIDVAEVPRSLVEIFEDVRDSRTHYIVTRDGESILAIVPIQVLEEWRRRHQPGANSFATTTE